MEKIGKILRQMLHDISRLPVPESELILNGSRILHRRFDTSHLTLRQAVFTKPPIDHPPRDSSNATFSSSTMACTARRAESQFSNRSHVSIQLLILQAPGVQRYCSFHGLLISA